MANEIGILQQALKFSARPYIRAFSLLACGVLLSSVIALPVRAADETLPSLCGVPLGIRAVSPHSPFYPTSLAGHLGNPTAILTPVLKSDFKRGIWGMSGWQLPPFAGADIFLNSDYSSLPHWAQSIALSPTPSQVEWLYNRMSYAMGFEVTRSGIVDGIVVSGVKGGNTQLLMQNNYQPVNLGESLSALRADWGQADVTKTYPDHAAKNSAASAKEVPEILVMIYKIEGQQSYWVTITTRYNRIVRISLTYGPDMERTDAFPKPRPLVID